MTWLVDAEPISTTLAARRARLAAFLIDQAISVAMLLLARYLALSVVGILLYLCFFGVGVVQIILVATRGQTIGKLILKIAIVDRIDKTPPGFVRAGLIRQLPLMVVNLFTPTFTLLYLTLDGSLIFGSSRRCVHDRLAGTIVINVAPDGASAPF